ncbi:MAG TPA: argininosuccinate lyase [Candidatus Bathyarchaeia archaeon]|nr:argininosuccinate lyase [Candidatus Bathyarchaeia archaeon]
MAQLWHKGYDLDELVSRFTSGDDQKIDKKLVFYDCLGSIAHGAMLHKIQVLSTAEYQTLKQVLLDIIEQHKQEQFVFSHHDEDVHTAVENAVTKMFGDGGKKMHTARSRNDQILLDMRLYMRDNVLDIADTVAVLCTTLIARAQELSAVPMPGRTHFQRAMPSSWGLLLGSYAESLADSMFLLQSAYTLVNQSPLGSAASYGVPMPIDRAYVAQVLGFDRVQNNVLYANNSRGKIESVVLHALSQIMLDLAKMSTDFIIFSTPEFGYVYLPEKLCTGSSLMPQKRNPDVLELVRARSATVISYLMQVFTIIRALPSGYNRDFQETKYPVFHSFALVHDALILCDYIVREMVVNVQTCIDAFSSDLFATDYALQLVQKGIPFRQAYGDVATHLDQIPSYDPVAYTQEMKHEGATGNLGLEKVTAFVGALSQWSATARAHYEHAYAQLFDT